MGIDLYKDLIDQWNLAWPKALKIWSPFTRLKSPIYCTTEAQAQKEGLTSSFAMIRLNDYSIVINLQEIRQKKLDQYALEILAHEIGHHILAPANLNDNARVLARIRKALPTIEHQAPFVANLYEDLLINDRLKRSSELKIDQVYQQIIAKGSDDLWKFYMRTYEILWSLTKETLTLEAVNDSIESDAKLAAKIVRSYAKDWISGAAKYAFLCLPYFLNSKKLDKQYWLASLVDSVAAGKGGLPSGLSDFDPEELEDIIHPADDPELTDLDTQGVEQGHDTNYKKHSPQGNAKGQAREPFEFGEILKATGLNISESEAAIIYYKEQALPHLVKYPQKKIPQSLDPLPEGLETWQLGEALEEVDWQHSIMRHGRVIPTVSLDKRVYGNSPGNDPETIPVDLDIYIDSSGSMPNPKAQISYLALAASIIALSALRVGARVKATLWSGKNQFYSTNGFINNEKEILRIITEFFGGGTQFPNHLLRDTYSSRKLNERAVHILIISDDGISTLLDIDEKGNSGIEIAANAIKHAKGGGSMVLNMQEKALKSVIPENIRNQIGDWNFYFVQAWEDLIQFAKAFSRQKYDFN